MTTPTWTVRVAGGEAPTALIVERPDGALVSDADATDLYTLINGVPPTEDPDPDMPPGLSPGRCGRTDVHVAHVATMQGDDGSTVEFWCTGVTAELLEAEAEGVAVDG